MPIKTTPPLRRVLGTTTAMFIGVGVAIGSGIFRTPSAIAGYLGSPGWIIAAWVAGGLFTLAAGLVTAELATRFPRAGGEYVFLREAYGEFTAFFFGWAYTIFGIGGGVAIMAVALGEVTCDLLRVAATWAPWFAVASLAIVTVLNAMGLRVGADTQNVFSAAKVLALVAIGVAAYVRRDTAATPVAPVTPATGPTWLGFVSALQCVLWSYDGATDSARMAEEVRDVRRALPRALLIATGLLTAVYVLVNVAFLRVMAPAEMSQSTFVGNEIMRRVAGPAGMTVLAGITAFVCFGALVSTQLSSVRVTFALARDGLAIPLMAGMSRAQSPVGALVVVGLLSAAFAAFRGFSEVLSIYQFATAILFSLNYASLLIVRARDRGTPSNVFHCPAAPLLVAILIAMEVWIGYGIARTRPMDTIYTTVLLAVIAVAYLVRRRTARMIVDSPHNDP